MRGLLLAAGVGKRLKPLTDTTPKPLLPIGGKPILEWVIMGCREAGIDRIAIITGHLEDQIRDYFKTGRGLGVSLEYFTQHIRNGTAGAILPAMDFLRGHPFFMSYGDILVHPANYGLMMDRYRAEPDISVISGREVADPSAGGVLITSGDRLVDIIEKPAPGESPGNIINAGLMVFQPDILDDVRRVRPSPRGELELTDAMVSLARRSPVKVHKISGFWSDVGTPEKLAEADDWAENELSALYDVTE